MCSLRIVFTLMSDFFFWHKILLCSQFWPKTQSFCFILPWAKIARSLADFSVCSCSPHHTNGVSGRLPPLFFLFFFLFKSTLNFVHAPGTQIWPSHHPQSPCWGHLFLYMRLKHVSSCSRFWEACLELPSLNEFNPWWETRLALGSERSGDV